MWEQSERVSARLKAKEISGQTVNLKLKSADFRIRTRAQTLEAPTQLAARIFEASRELLIKEADGTKYRLLGVGVTGLDEGEFADPADLINQRAMRVASAEHAIDRVRKKYGDEAMIKGLVFDEDP